MAPLTTKDYVSLLDMQEHPEGGYYKEIYRSPATVTNKDGETSRPSCTAIYFLLQEGSFSAFHRLTSDEVWNFYDGDPLEVIEIAPDGVCKFTVLGSNISAGESFQHIVPAGTWFGARMLGTSVFSLVGCTVAPGFVFEDFELAARSELQALFPAHHAIIESLTRQ